jgi:hypothetical protein
MRTLSFAAGVLLAVFVVAPGYAGPEKTNSMMGAKKRAAVQVSKPTWEQCYAMSRQRGFDHELDEWLQSIQDCMDGKIPL